MLEQLDGMDDRRYTPEQRNFTPKEAEENGFPVLGNLMHVCVDLPIGESAMVIRLPGERHVAIRFLPQEFDQHPDSMELEVVGKDGDSRFSVTSFSPSWGPERSTVSTLRVCLDPLDNPPAEDSGDAAEEILLDLSGLDSLGEET